MGGGDGSEHPLNIHMKMGIKSEKLVLTHNNGWVGEGIQPKSFIRVGPGHPRVSARLWVGVSNQETGTDTINATPQVKDYHDTNVNRISTCISSS